MYVGRRRGEENESVCERCEFDYRNSASVNRWYVVVVGRGDFSHTSVNKRLSDDDGCTTYAVWTHAPFTVSFSSTLNAYNTPRRRVGVTRKKKKLQIGKSLLRDEENDLTDTRNRTIDGYIIYDIPVYRAVRLYARVWARIARDSSKRTDAT